jgi:hypothetical protein
MLVTGVGVNAPARSVELVDVGGHDGFGNDLSAVAGGVRDEAGHKAPSG